MSLADGARISGKLVWKVDWPMRWKHEGVIFEPAGEDHHSKPVLARKIGVARGLPRPGSAVVATRRP